MARLLTAALWLLTRGLTLWLFLGPEAWVTGDVGYFADSLRLVPQAGLGGTLVEYPLPAVGVLAVPWWLSGLTGGLVPYATLVTAAVLATDAAFTALLLELGGRRRGAAVVVWLLAVPALGATAYARFDLLPGVLVGVALLLAPAHPRVSATAATVATAVKLWPALVLPPLVAGARRRRDVLLRMLVVGTVLAAASLVAGGWDRLVSPLRYQADRGLQVESLAATPAMLGWWRRPDLWTVTYAPSHAYEVSGPGVGSLVRVTSVLGVALAVGLALLWWRALRPRSGVGAGVGMDAVVWTALAAVLGFVVSGKVLSPQYLLWLLPAAAAGLAVTSSTRPALVRWSALLLVATALTHLVFPVSYLGVVQPDPSTGRAVLLLAARNLLLVWLLVGAWRHAWRGTAPRPTTDASGPD